MYGKYREEFLGSVGVVWLANWVAVNNTVPLHTHGVLSVITVHEFFHSLSP